MQAIETLWSSQLWYPAVVQDRSSCLFHGLQFLLIHMGPHSYPYTMLIGLTYPFWPISFAYIPPLLQAGSFLPWRRQYVSLKCWYPCTRLHHSVIIQKTTWIFTSVKSLNLIQKVHKTRYMEVYHSTNNILQFILLLITSEQAFTSFSLKILKWSAVFQHWS